jgi:putative ABC transport system permease protein
MNRKKKEIELREELEFHLDAEAEERAAAGLSPPEARSAARRELGNLGRVMEESRAAWGWTFLDNLRQDLKLAGRSLRKNPGFSALVVLILGAGIGANTAVFSVVNTVVLKPLAYRDPDRILVLSTWWKKSGPGGNVSTPDFHDWHDQSTSFEAMAYHQGGESAVVVNSTPEFGANANVSAEFFQVFGVEPVAGRLFSEEELKPGSGAAVLVSYSFWQSHYGADPSALGKTIRLGGRALPIVGVLPPGFHFPGTTDIWVPANTIFPESTFRSAHNVQVVAKLKKGVTVEQAQAEMTAIGSRLTQQYPTSNADKNVAVSGLRDDMVKDARLMLYILLGAVGVVLLIACGNVANLLMVKASRRGREIAVRSALGGSRGRIVRQLFTESLLLALTSGAVGLLMAMAGSRALVALAPGNVPRLADTHVDGWVLGFAFLVSTIACLLFGLVPAFRAAGVDVNHALKQGAARGPIGGRSALSSALVVAEIALSVMLLTGAGLLIRSFAALQDVALGFRPENVLIMETSMTAGTSANQAMPVYRRLLEEAASIPGVVAVGATRVPPGTVRTSGAYWIDRAPSNEQMSVTAPQTVYSVVSPGAFAVLGIPLKRGRDFDAGDAAEGKFTAIINETLANREFPGKDPLGHTVVTPVTGIPPRALTIVGVVGDIRQRGPASKPDAEVYMNYQQIPGMSTQMRIIARTTLAPEQLTQAFRHKAREVAPLMPVKFTTLEARMAEIVAAPKFRTLLFAIFAALAVGLAMAGVYGVVSFVVSQRTSEIGLRMALGADCGNILRMVISHGVSLALIGLTLGLAAAFVATGLLSTMLFAVKPSDPLTYAAVAALIAVTTLLASYIPARRAARVDPLVALRQE